MPEDIEPPENPKKTRLEPFAVLALITGLPIWPIYLSLFIFGDAIISVSLKLFYALGNFVFYSVFLTLLLALAAFIRIRRSKGMKHGRHVAAIGAKLALALFIWGTLVDALWFIFRFPDE